MIKVRGAAKGDVTSRQLVRLKKRYPKEQHMLARDKKGTVERKTITVELKTVLNGSLAEAHNQR